MIFKTVYAAALAFALSGAAIAQQAVTPPVRTTPAATAPAATAPAATAAAPAAVAPTAVPAASARPAARATLPAGTKVNLNSATAEQLDALPQIGKARTKVIMTERAKTPFKDWADFDARTQHTSVNAGVKAKIKDYVIF